MYRHTGTYEGRPVVVMGYNKARNRFLILDAQNALNDHDRTELGNLLKTERTQTVFNLAESLRRETHLNGGDWFRAMIPHSREVPVHHVRLADAAQAIHWFGTADYTDSKGADDIEEVLHMNEQPETVAPETLPTYLGKPDLTVVDPSQFAQPGPPPTPYVPTSNEDLEGLKEELKAAIEGLGKRITKVETAIRSATREMKKASKGDTTTKKGGRRKGPELAVDNTTDDKEGE